jgi:hypothetical protein
VSVSLTLLNFLQYADIIVTKKLGWDCKVMYYIQTYEFEICDTVSTSSFETDNTGNIDNDNCAKCSDCELQLKEALEELSSAHKIIEILQTELQAFKTSSTTCDKG